MMRTFRSMGTDVTVCAPALTNAGERRVAGTVARIFSDNEARFSRFRADSELSRLNAARGPIVVSPDLFDVLRCARRWFDLTGGIFDPTVGATLVALGYDTSFSPGAPRALGRRRAGAAAPACSFADVLLDDGTRTVDKPPHVALDLGGIVKGRTVDVAASILPRPGAVDAGGDAVVRAGGTGGAGPGWIIEVEDPRDAMRALVEFTLRDGAVATSGVNRRRWSVGGRAVHHLIDPRTAKPAASDLAQVTVVAATAERAEVLAKSALVLGRRDGTRLLESAAVAAILVGVDAGIHRVGTPEAPHA
jgi:thiamine biosynthesis lipoprotein